ncbi:hypothetical protein FOCC_FOCC007592 [Frankliniella occidentalis]|nr:hypothetical protein FOCC_FOCC007592 [Frankliniella occidentalis]
MPHVNRALVSSILNSVAEFLMCGHLEFLETSVERIFTHVEGHEQDKISVRQMFSVMKNPFNHLKTEHQRFSVLSDSCPSLKPSPYFIGQLNNEMVRRGDVMLPGQVGVKGQVVPLRHTLKQFLELPGVLQEILHHMDFLNNEEQVVSNVIQGTLWRESSENFGDKLVLPLNLCYDDFVPDNTLMAHGGDTELGPLYCSIPVLPAKYLGALENIFVASIFLTKHRKLFGNAAVFRPVIEELQFLYNEGIEVITENGMFKIYFCLCCVLGDNKGINEICGFSKSFSANFYCRFCRGHKTVLQYEIVCNAEIRTRDNYAVDVAANNFQTTGVHEECVWNAVPNFHCSSSISCDLQHDICEGDLWVCLSRILWCLMYEQGYFDLELLKQRVEGFNYGCLEVGNRPPLHILTREKLQSEQCPFSAAEMLCFARYLGEFVGHLVPEDDVYWQFYVCHRTLLDVLFAPSFIRGAENYVEAIIQEHHATFLRLFNEPLKPKQHLMLHYKSIMLRVGPLVHLWSMRFESKHRELKDYVISTNSRIDLPLTVFIKNQLRFCHRLISKRGLAPEVIAGPSHQYVFANVEHYFDCNGPGVPEENDHCRVASWVKVFNSPFQKGLCVLLRIEDNVPVFGRISSVLLSDPFRVSFIINVLQPIHFNFHLHAYIVESTDRWEFCNLQQLASDFPLYSRLTVDGLTLISLRHL